MGGARHRLFGERRRPVASWMGMVAKELAGPVEGQTSKADPVGHTQTG